MVGYWQRIQQQGQQLLKRTLDRHLRLAVTGLSRSGKTAFITSLVNQLLEGSYSQQLPFFEVVQDDRLLGVRRAQQPHPEVASFRYDLALQSLSGEAPEWPEPTKGLSEIRLALRFLPATGISSWLSEPVTLLLDIIDYPGEWLLDLPMLEQSFLSWSEQQWALLNQSPRQALASDWLGRVAALGFTEAADDHIIRELAEQYTTLIQRFRTELGLHFLQPGRFLLPGEMKGAPILNFFPVPVTSQDKVSNECLLAELTRRYNSYCDQVVKRFYKEHFAQVDRQIVLADCLQPLNAGSGSFNDLQLALEQIAESFNYGKSNFLTRLFSPKIDRLLFVATKADHVTPDQHGHMVALLTELVQGIKRHVRFDGITVESMALASIRATQAGFCDYQGKQIPAIEGHQLTDRSLLTLFPGEVPSSPPKTDYWEKKPFRFVEFFPPAKQLNQPLPHIRMDQALDFLLGDKLQ
ncbi:YcjX family GTP-binding protein [Spartinivicinus ruber]|uniref:YcjX family protein n=1 Tax=Spartinivicinus ruber TaxID=2683272 RepID=UPI0013D33079|nr:YcjX family protein [Spartinivicinus ruber]